MCSAADDPTTFEVHLPFEVVLPKGLTTYLGNSAANSYTFRSHTDDERLEIAIARRNIAWAAWQWEADDLVNRITDGEPAPYGPYNDAQKAYEHAVTDLMREQARWRHNRHG